MKGLWPTKPIRVIPFLTSDRPVPEPNRRAVLGLRPLRVAYLGRMVEQKRPHQLVRSWQRLTLNPSLAGARLEVYGYDPEGHMIQELKSLVISSGMAEQIRIQGEYNLDELPAIFRKTDVIVLPSLWEGLPLVLVEAMQHGVPFVATSAGGTCELGEDNPDVTVTGTEWSEFENGLLRMADMIRRGEINHARLHRWVEKGYGFTSVSARWLACLQSPSNFFGLDL